MLESEYTVYAEFFLMLKFHVIKIIVLFHTD